MSFESIKLGELLELLTDYHANGAYEKLKENVELLDEPSYAIMIRTTNFEQNNFSTSLKFINEHAYNFLAKSKVYPGDIIMNKIANAGSCYFMPDLKSPVSLAMNLFLLRVKTEKVNPTYLYIYLKLNEAYVKSFANGSVTKTITKDAVRNLEIKLPKRKIQNQISDVFNTLTQKIELNRQINETLESMVQVLFKSWFVDFDPVIDNALAAGKPIPDVFAERAEQRRELNANAEKPHISGGVSFNASENNHQLLFPSEFEFNEEMGWIPKGWEVSDVGSEFNTVGGGTPSTKNTDFWENGDINWTTPKDLSGSQSKVLFETNRRITNLGLQKISSGLLPVDTVLMSSRAPVGYLALAKVPVAINQGYIAIKCEKTLTSEYALLWTDSIMDEIKQRAGGTTFAEISKKSFREIPILVPSKDSVELLSTIIKGYYDAISSNLKESQTLEEIRDTLLPKLLSGQVRLEANVNV